MCQCPETITRVLSRKIHQWLCCRGTENIQRNSKASCQSETTNDWQSTWTYLHPDPRTKDNEKVPIILQREQIIAMVDYVGLSIRLSVWYTLVLYHNNASLDHELFGCRTFPLNIFPLRFSSSGKREKEKGKSPFEKDETWNCKKTPTF